MKQHRKLDWSRLLGFDQAKGDRIVSPKIGDKRGDKGGAPIPLPIPDDN